MKSIETRLEELHEGDRKQLEVIFSDKKRIIVEAPAGYGKTATMVSRIAFLYTKGVIPNPKKILALTFSVNAALKIKRDVAEKLPILVQEKNNPINIGEKVVVTNFHGFCKEVLSKYGHRLTTLLRRNINDLCAIGDDVIEKKSELKAMNTADVEYMKYIDRSIKASIMPTDVDIAKYNRIIIENLLPHDMITHTAIILLTIELFDRCQQVRRFYQNYFTFIVVDEFQDTNCISWALLKKLVHNNSQILLLGDPLQRIYGFIGAIPNIMKIAQDELNADTIQLEKNYRFKDNYEMLKLDRNIRLNAIQLFNPTIGENAKVETFWASNQQNEAEKLVKKISTLHNVRNKEKIAILFRSRGENSDLVEQELAKKDMKFFYGMFTDDDSEYINFHRFCYREFANKFGGSASIGKRSLNDFSKMIARTYYGTKNKMVESLCTLLDAFVKKVSYDYSDLSAEDKYSLVLDTLENRQLKQAMEYVDSDIILSTIHGAKGLEWPYVFLADFEKWSFPGYFTCKDCVNRFSNPIKSSCPLPSVEAMNVDNMLDELSVLYVAVTRAKKQVYVSASAKRANGKDGCLSCMSHLPGIEIVNAERLR